MVCRHSNGLAQHACSKSNTKHTNWIVFGYREHLVAPFAALLQDAEPEVRMVAAEAVAAFSAHLTEPIITASVLPHLKTLTSDSSQFVRTAAASVVMALSPMLGKEGTVTHLLDLYIKLLTDKCPEVRAYLGRCFVLNSSPPWQCTCKHGTDGCAGRRRDVTSEMV